MSIRKRTWKTAKGEAKEAWVVDYVDGAGKRRLKTFSKKKEADAYETTAKHELAQGTHTPDSASVTVAEAAERWLKTCESRDYPSNWRNEALEADDFEGPRLRGRSSERRRLARDDPQDSREPRGCSV